MTTKLDDVLLLNKAVLDASVDIPTVLSANNKDERRERFNRAAISWFIAFASPFLLLPFVNKFAIRHVGKLTSNLSDKEANLIRLSYKYLTNKSQTEKGLSLLSKELNTDYSKIVSNVSGDYELLRQRILNAKNTVLGVDIATTAGALSGVGYFNNWQTKKKTKRNGFSAEFNMADKSVIDERAKKFQKTETLRKILTLGVIGGLAISMPLLLKKGFNQPSSNWGKYLTRNAEKFDYKLGVCMNRTPCFITILAAYFGISMASRNSTELKDNLVRAAVGQSAFFGGDLIIDSTLARLSDRIFGTEILDKSAPKTILNKIVPPTKRIKDLNGKSKNTAIALFWVNLGMLSLLMGRGTPYLLNKMIKKDVNNDTLKQENSLKWNSMQDDRFKEFKL